MRLFGEFYYQVVYELSVAVTIVGGHFEQVSVIYHQSKKVILLVDKSHVKSMENPKTTLPFSDIYIGGAPSSILKSRSVKCTGIQKYHTQQQQLHVQYICHVWTKTL